MQTLQLEYSHNQARKYKLMSKSKHASSKLDGGNTNIAQKNEELLKLTKAKSQQEAEIKNIKATIARLEKERTTFTFNEVEESTVQSLQQETRSIYEYADALTKTFLQLSTVEE